MAYIQCVIVDFRVKVSGVYCSIVSACIVIAIFSVNKTEIGCSHVLQVSVLL